MFSGQPYPELEDQRQLVKVPGLDLYAEPHPFWPPWPWEIKSTIDLLEFGIMCGQASPSTRSASVAPPAEPADSFDIVHDNQCLAPGCSR
jgi:hypothetical protein